MPIHLTPIPRKEEFILDVRRSARTLQNPNVEADTDAIDTDAISRILRRAALWLTPSVVESYDPNDFADCEDNQQDQLRSAVDEFRQIASHVPGDQPATVEQFNEGTERFRKLIQVLGGMIREEWLNEIDSVEKRAEEWSREREWRTQRVNKKMNESLIGSYDSTQLLIFAAPHLYVLDPIARFVPGAQGAFDFAIQPSYNTTSLYRAYDGVWYVHTDSGVGTANGRRKEWEQCTFFDCIEQLGALV